MFDIGIILILVMFTLVGLKQGILKTGIPLIGMILIFIISFIFKGVLGNIFCRYLPFFNLEGNYEGLSSINILIYQLLGFLIIFGLLLSVYAIIVKLTKVLDIAVKATLVLIIPSKIFGAILGFIEGYIIVFLCLVVLTLPLQDVDVFASSKVVNHIVYKSPVLTKTMSPITKTMKEAYKLGDQIIYDKISKKEANKKLLNSMIKNKIVSQKLVDELIKSKKLKMSTNY